MKEEKLQDKLSLAIEQASITSKLNKDDKDLAVEFISSFKGRTFEDILKITRAMSGAVEALSKTSSL